ncbi:MAG: energy-coupling factor transporter transmembrane component T [Lachnospiraceae bacterium]|nr:energy-coupling factor transporter transmembrane component T [Lachnospiraceae bacterium]
MSTLENSAKTITSNRDIHPLSLFFFYLFVILCPMFSLHPLLLSLSFVMGTIYVRVLFDRRTLMKSLLSFLPFALLLVLINGLTSHYGESILFFINGNRITLEALLRGFFMALALWAVLLWCLTFQKVLSRDKLIWLFSAWAPRLGLTISMVLHYLPNLRSRFQEVHDAELAMGHEGHSRMQKIRQSSIEFSTVLSWSLEIAIETGDSMDARGYALHHKTSYNRFHWNSRSLCFLILTLILGPLSLAGTIRLRSAIRFYPTFALSKAGPGMVFTVLVYFCLTALPLLSSSRQEKGPVEPGLLSNLTQAESQSTPSQLSDQIRRKPQKGGHQ